MDDVKYELTFIAAIVVAIIAIIYFIPKTERGDPIEAGMQNCMHKTMRAMSADIAYKACSESRARGEFGK